MDQRGADRRPPRSARPISHSASPTPQQHQSPVRPSIHPSESSKAGVSFQDIEQGDRKAQLDSNKQRTLQSAYLPQLTSGDPEGSDQYDPSRVGRKKSLVRPDREKIDPNHRQWHYRTHVAQLEEEGTGRLGVMPSSELHFWVFLFLFSQLFLSFLKVLETILS